MISSLKLILIAAQLLIVLSSCGWNPNFHAEGTCLVTNRGNSFHSLKIEIEATNQTYYIWRVDGAEGRNKLCLNELPNGYLFVTGIDTISAISLIDGQRIKVDNSGGDRHSVNWFIVKDGRLETIH
jgi:hypothetical protein